MSIATDYALATIASILAPPEAARGKTKPAPTQNPVDAGKSVAPVPFEAAGYSKTGPGPMAAIRIRWTVRHGDDGYYVDETIGAGSVPVVNGPMSGDAAMSFVDARAREAQERFDALRNEMTGQRSTAPIPAPGVGETGLSFAAAVSAAARENPS
jgi:hypothetical protein